jgi:GNAT superfamily N-acetyltransferase
MHHTINLATSEQEIAATYAVMHQLRPHLIKSQYIENIKRLQQHNHFKLAYLSANDNVCSVSGFRITESLAWGKFVYVDDLVTLDVYRSTGFGQALLNWISGYAKQFDCLELHLDSGVQRHEAHRFYLRERLDITCYHFRKKLT